MIYLHSKFRVQWYTIVIAMKPEPKYRGSAAIMLFYTLQKHHLNKSCKFFEDLLHFSNQMALVSLVLRNFMLLPCC